MQNKWLKLGAICLALFFLVIVKKKKKKKKKTEEEEEEDRRRRRKRKTEEEEEEERKRCLLYNSPGQKFGRSNLTSTFDVVAFASMTASR